VPPTGIEPICESLSGDTRSSRIASYLARWLPCSPAETGSWRGLKIPLGTLSLARYVGRFAYGLATHIPRRFLGRSQPLDSIVRVRVLPIFSPFPGDRLRAETQFTQVVLTVKSRLFRRSDCANFSGFRVRRAGRTRATLPGSCSLSSKQWAFVIGATPFPERASQTPVSHAKRRPAPITRPVGDGLPVKPPGHHKADSRCVCTGLPGTGDVGRHAYSPGLPCACLARGALPGLYVGVRGCWPALLGRQGAAVCRGRGSTGGRGRQGRACRLSRPHDRAAPGLASAALCGVRRIRTRLAWPPPGAYPPAPARDRSV
jgi:hypothetical protein